MANWEKRKEIGTKVPHWQWKIIQEKIPPSLRVKRSRTKTGPKPWSDKDCFMGILWIIQSGLPWDRIWESNVRYENVDKVSGQVCKKRFQKWEMDVFVEMWKIFFSFQGSKRQREWIERIEFYAPQLNTRYLSPQRLIDAVKKD